MPICFQALSTPLGLLFLAADDTALRAVAFVDNWPRIKKVLGDISEQNHPLLESAAQQLSEYFAGQRKVFDLPLHLRGTGFQQQAWRALLSIPYGETRDYSQQAAMLGKPDATRAIGHANGQNPLSIVVPCHRVIAKSGRLAGYAGGLEAKRRLLELESAHANPAAQLNLRFNS